VKQRIALASHTDVPVDRSIEHHLAQLSIGLAKGPMDGTVMAGFKEALEPVNALADEAPGFVWRLQTEDGDATVWRVIAGRVHTSRRAFVFQSARSGRRRAEPSRSCDRGEHGEDDPLDGNRRLRTPAVRTSGAQHGGELWECEPVL
jgi:hypothetical protein